MDDGDCRTDHIGPLEDARPPLQTETIAAVETLVTLWTRTARTGTPQYSALQLHALHAARTTPGIGLSALADALGSAPSATSRLCDRLEAAGLMRRQPAPANRRAIGLTLTRRGHDVLDAASARRERLLRQVLDRMPAHACRQLLTGLHGFAAASRAADLDGPT